MTVRGELRRAVSGRWSQTAGRAQAYVRGSPRLNALRAPLSSPRFWATQGLVALVGEANFLVDALGLMSPRSASAFLLESLFIIPVIYAAMHFGLRGTVWTAIWCTVIMTPSWMFWHEGADRIAIITQMAVLFAVAGFVGNRRDRERTAESATQDALGALRISEEKHRALFETAGEGILVVDDSGAIVECNAAAGILLQRAPVDVVGRSASDGTPAEMGTGLAKCARQAQECDPLSEGPLASPTCAGLMLPGPDGQDRWIEPVCTRLPGAEKLSQIILRDVTAQKLRQTWLESYSSRVLTAQEEERRRIAQEIHDDPVQSLLMVCRDLDEIDGVLPAALDDASGPLRDVRAHTESALGSLRAILYGLRPSVLDDLGLIPAVGRLVRDLRSRSKIDVRLVQEGQSQRLRADVELAVYRIAQEAMHNMERHSGASQGTVTLRYLDRSFELTVTDDGGGFSPPRVTDPLTPESRLGILGMHERMRTIGGELTIQSELGHGTTVHASVTLGATAIGESPASPREADVAATNVRR